MAAALSLVRVAGRGCIFTRPSIAGAGCLNVFITPSFSSTVKTPTTNYTTAVERGIGGKHWKYERVVAVSLLGLIPTGLVYPNPLVDYGLAIAIPLHGHWGLQSVIEDYVPQNMKKASHILLYCVSIGTFAGLLYLNYTDVGICKAVKMIWSL